MRKLWMNKPILIAVVAIVLLIVLAAFTVGDRTVTYANGLFRSAAMPVQETLSKWQTAVGDFFVRVFQPSSVQAENDALRAELLQKERELALYEETAKQNAALSELCNFVKANPNMRYVTAEVIGRDSNPYLDVLTLNVGTRHGVAASMAVISADGVVGRVTEVGPNWCRVSTLCNDTLRISVMVQRSRDEGMLGGLVEQDGALLGTRLYYLPANADLRVGDTIITSGLGGVFPRGLYVGEVLACNDDGAGQYDAVVSLDVDYAHLEQVLVIVDMDEVVTE